MISIFVAHLAVREGLVGGFDPPTTQVGGRNPHPPQRCVRTNSFSTEGAQKEKFCLFLGTRWVQLDPSGKGLYGRMGSMVGGEYSPKRCKKKLEKALLAGSTRRHKKIMCTNIWKLKPEGENAVQKQKKWKHYLLGTLLFHTWKMPGPSWPLPPAPRCSRPCRSQNDGGKK